jgi:hypothetical protein
MILGVLSASLFCLVIGCGGDKTYRVSGKVTFKGQPLPAGRIYFMPDTKAGNKGASCFADIKNGAYDTASSGGRGSSGGAMTVRIEGWDPSQPQKSEKGGESSPKALFTPYQTNADLPKEDATKDFDVPAAAAKGPAGGGGKAGDSKKPGDSK